MLLTNSGSEATYAALRLARAVTDRNKIIKFQGTYHGWHDAVLMNVISAPGEIGQHDPLSLGMLPDTIEQTIILPFNDVEAVSEMIQQRFALPCQYAALGIEATESDDEPPIRFIVTFRD